MNEEQHHLKGGAELVLTEDFADDDDFSLLDFPSDEYDEAYFEACYLQTSEVCRRVINRAIDLLTPLRVRLEFYIGTQEECRNAEAFVPCALQKHSGGIQSPPLTFRIRQTDGGWHFRSNRLERDFLIPTEDLIESLITEMLVTRAGGELFTLEELTPI